VSGGVYVPLDALLLRAPLLPEAAVGDAGALLAHRLGRTAIELASESLARAKGGAAKRAMSRYARRAAFRPTPAGLLAGVCVGELGAGLAVATGGAAAALAPSWARMAALGRALLDDPALRARARLRVAPSLVQAAGGGVRWIGPGDPFGETREAEVDERLARVLATAAAWAAWGEVRRAWGGDEDEDEDGDQILLLLVDQGVLISDLVPPLVGEEAGNWMKKRLEALGRGDEAAALEGALRAFAGEDLDGGRRALGALPGGDAPGPDVNAVLVFHPRRPPRLPRAAVERAAALAPLLFAIQEALAPPAAERLAQPALADALDATTEIFGAGALDLDALAGGAYGVDPASDDEAAAALAPPAALVAALAGAIVDAASNGRDQAALDSRVLATALGAGAGALPTPPPSAELFLTPGRAPRGARPGTGWLLGLHAPAGASWGRFAGALGAPLVRALGALDAAERAARPFEERLDVAFAPSPALADLCAHPPVRARALALSSWSDGADLAPRDLELCADPSADPPLALRHRGEASPQVLAPSPLARVRSATAPAGLARLLVGWSLFRQHAPWALALGPLGGLARLPRLSLDGFVVCPASWAVPAPIRAGAAGRAAVRRWRRDAGLPRWVQVGGEDLLLPVDLDGADAAADLRGADRAWEIWPPLGEAVDRDGRRVEAVVALVDRPGADEGARLGRAAHAAAAIGRVPPPRAAPALPGWLTLKLFGPADLQDAVLAGAVGPAIRAGRRAREIEGWFFIRYVDGPGRRPHLRVRARGTGRRGLAAFEARLGAALVPARDAGALTTVERTEYHPERARFGGTDAALDAIHAVFESDSDLACALLAAETESIEVADRTALLVRALDALARGLGMDATERHALARGRRRAGERSADLDPEARAARDRAFRALGRGLRAALSGRAADRDAAARALDAHAARTARAIRRLAREQRAALAPALLHLACVRLAGPDREVELDAYTFWERALEGLLRSDDFR
jgi:thiopeptide-type bacteriocin biosynthesis protein